MLTKGLRIMVTGHCLQVFLTYQQINIYTRTLYEAQCFNCLLTQIANQPNTWPQLNALRHADVVKTPSEVQTEH